MRVFSVLALILLAVTLTLMRAETEAHLRGGALGGKSASIPSKAPIDRKNDTKSGSHNPVDVYEGHLVIKNLITPRAIHAAVDDQGYLTSMGINSTYTSFSLDVGFNRGQTSKVWHAEQPNLYVVAIEANAHLVRQFEFGPEFEGIRPNTMVVQAAASSHDGGVITFNPGFGWNNVSDTGSIFGFRDPKREAVRLQYLRSHLSVRNMRLSDLLKHVPPPRNTTFVWDTLKVDVQGSDVDALMSAGDFVDNFVCVVGEFEIDNYNVPKGFPIDPGPFLKQHKFVLTRDNNKRGNSIWLNSRFFDLYKSRPQRFGCANVYDSQVKPHEIIAAYEKGGLTW
jgi:FkbM family methyltransferase